MLYAHKKAKYSSNVVHVRKKDGSLRFCIDIKKLNSRTVKDAYDLPSVDYTFDTWWVQNIFQNLICVVVISKSKSTRLISIKLHSPLETWGFSNVPAWLSG